MTGHLLGGAGGLEAGITILAMLQPDRSADHEPGQRRPGLPPELRPQQARRQAKIDYALSNSFGFGGTNGSLVFKRWGAE